MGKTPYTFAWLLGFVITSLVYVALSTIWKPTETMIERAIKPDDVYDAGDSYGIETVDGVEQPGSKAWGGEKDELAIV